MFDIIKTNSPVNATDHELTYGNNNYINNYKSVNIYNNGLITDTVIWVHEISHYRNQPDTKRNEVNDILTELVAFTEEFIYTDYLSKIGYEKESEVWKIKEYQNLYKIIKIGVPFVKIHLVYHLLGELTEENFKKLFIQENYEKHLEHFEKIIEIDQDILFTILWYSIGVISIYNLERYKEQPRFINNINKLNEALNQDISLEDALKIIEIKLDKESLQKVLEKINKFKDRIETNQNIITK